MTAPVPQAAVDAVREAIEAHRLCANTCSCGWATDTSPGWVERAAAHAHEAVAAAVVAAVQVPIKVEALREAADVMDREGNDRRVLARSAFKGLAPWIRDRADRIEAEPPADAHTPEERILRDILTNQPE